MTLPPHCIAPIAFAVPCLRLRSARTTPPHVAQSFTNPPGAGNRKRLPVASFERIVSGPAESRVF
jgi:hypothetical protein